MKKLTYFFILLISTATLFTSCREKKTTGDKIKDNIENIEDDIKDAADDVSEEIKETKEAIEKEVN